MSATNVLVDVRNLVKKFTIARSFLGKPLVEVHAVDGVSFAIGHRETLGLVGESGCGKSSVARLLSRLIEPTSGEIRVEDRDIAGAKGEQLRDLRKAVQIVFQDPYASLNPRMRAADIVGEPLKNYGVGTVSERAERVRQLFRSVGLRDDQLDRYPHEFSGGQRQRIGIARALALRPKLIILDEPVSALDVSVQAQVINLLIDLQSEFGVSFLFVAHDLAVVEHVSDRVAVMYLGRIVEIADRDKLFGNPLHPYTKALLGAVLHPDPDQASGSAVLQGEVPSPLRPPSGCHFRTRCPVAMKRCAESRPPLQEIGSGHFTACHLFSS